MSFPSHQLSNRDSARCRLNDPLETCPMEPREGSPIITGSKSHGRAGFQKQDFFSTLETPTCLLSLPSISPLISAQSLTVPDLFWTSVSKLESGFILGRGGRNERFHQSMYLLLSLLASPTKWPIVWNHLFFEISEPICSVLISDFAHSKPTLHLHLQNQLSFLISLRRYHHLPSHSSYALAHTC